MDERDPSAAPAPGRRVSDDVGGRERDRLHGGAEEAAAVHVHDHHDHSHHDHIRTASKRGLTVVLALTATFMVVEFVGGLLSNSLALMADAGHMLSDAAAIGLSLFALSFAQRPATPEKTYGYFRLEILAALVNGATLAVIAVFIIFEAYRRLMDPQPVESGLMLAVAMAGLAVNVFAAVVLHRSAGESLNVRGAYLHVLGDLLGSVGAISAALVIMFTGWTPADPLISVFVSLLILVSSFRLLRESVDVLMEAVPPHIDLDDVRSAMLAVPGVTQVHDLHVWTLTSGYHALSAHAVVADPAEYWRVLDDLRRRIEGHFGISHITIQIERPDLYQIDA